MAEPARSVASSKSGASSKHASIHSQRSGGGASGTQAAIATATSAAPPAAPVPQHLHHSGAGSGAAQSGSTYAEQGSAAVAAEVVADVPAAAPKLPSPRHHTHFVRGGAIQPAGLPSGRASAARRADALARVASRPQIVPEGRIGASGGDLPAHVITGGPSGVPSGSDSVAGSGSSGQSVSTGMFVDEGEDELHMNHTTPLDELKRLRLARAAMEKEALPSSWPTPWVVHTSVRMPMVQVDGVTTIGGDDGGPGAASPSPRRGGSSSAGRGGASGSPLARSGSASGSFRASPGARHTPPGSGGARRRRSVGSGSSVGSGGRASAHGSPGTSPGDRVGVGGSAGGGGERGGKELWWACSRGDADEVLRMVASGAAVEWRHPVSRSTPLHAAAIHGHHKCVMALLSTAAMVASAGVSTGAPLPDDGTLRAGGHVDAAAGHSLVARLINIADVHGKTPLHDAAAKGHTATAVVLAQAGTDMQLKDVRGRTAVDAARVAGHEATADQLGSQSRAHWQSAYALRQAAVARREATVQSRGGSAGAASSSGAIYATTPSIEDARGGEHAAYGGPPDSAEAYAKKWASRSRYSTFSSAGFGYATHGGGYGYSPAKPTRKAADALVDSPGGARTRGGGIAGASEPDAAPRRSPTPNAVVGAHGTSAGSPPRIKGGGGRRGRGGALQTAGSRA